MLKNILTDGRKAGRERLLVFCGLFGLLLLVGVLALWILHLLFRPEIEQGALSPSSPSVEEVAPAVPATPTPTPTPAPATEGNETDGDAARRAEFTRGLAAYDADFADTLSAPGFAAWNAGEESRLKTAREGAIALFAGRDYGGAMAALDRLRDATVAAIAAWDDAFARSMAKADTALAAGDMAGARLAAQEAMRLKPDDPDALNVPARIAQASAMADALEKVAAARAEGDAAAEIAALDAALALDPGRADLAGRRATLQRAMNERRFATALASGLDAVSRGALAEAEQALATAQALGAGRDETRLLAGKVDDLDRKIRLAEALAAAESFAANDAWEQAHAHYGHALAAVPDDRTAVEGDRLSGEMVAAKREIDGFIAAPHRLSSSNIAALAQGTLDRSRSLRPLSPALAAAAGRLDRLLKDYVQEVEVRIISDGKTMIAVRGVGRVGLATDRIITLKPGRYTVEGKRSGYVSKLVRIDVPAGSGGTMPEVTVICDEPV